MYAYPDKLHVLLVEDNSSDIDLVKESLRIHGLSCQLSVAKDGIEALRFMDMQGPGNFPDIILLDLNLPRLDGLGVLEKLKSNPAYKQIPVIVFTTSQAEDDVASSYNAGANCFVTKPFALDQFMDGVKSIVEFWSRHARLPRSS